MQSACSGGTGTFIEKTARKLEIAPEKLSQMGYSGYTLHKISSKCGIFAEADANTLLKAGVTVEEIIASLFEAVVYQNLATLTRGNTPFPRSCCSADLICSSRACRKRGDFTWARSGRSEKFRSRTIAIVSSLIRVPEMLFITRRWAALKLGCARTPRPGSTRTRTLQWWIEEGQYEEKKKNGRGGLCERRRGPFHYSKPNTNSGKQQRR